MGAPSLAYPKGISLSCTSGCPTQDHSSWGECARSKNLQVAGVEAHKHNQSVSKELNAYADARKAGLQPASTRMADVHSAWRNTEATGTPFRADK